MNAKLFSEWLIEPDKKMKKCLREILLFLDNAPVHPIDIQLSNVKLCFFSAKTTNVVQPFDQSVINSFKCCYRRMLVKHIIAEHTMAHSSDQISITALDAVGRINKAWNTVSSTTIGNAFCQAGFSSISSENHDLATILC